MIVTQIGDELVSVRIFQDEAPILADTVWLQFDIERTFLYGDDGELIE